MVVLANSKMKVGGKAIPMTMPPAATPVSLAVFSDYINRFYVDQPDRLTTARMVLKLLYRAGMRTTRDWDMDLYRRFESLTSKSKPHMRHLLLAAFRRFWSIGLEKGWFPRSRRNSRPTVRFPGGKSRPRPKKMCSDSWNRSPRRLKGPEPCRISGAVRSPSSSSSRGFP